MEINKKQWIDAVYNHPNNFKSKKKITLLLEEFLLLEQPKRLIYFFKYLKF